jgi:Spy/CpxP family protein refolding chaperone
MMKRSLFCMAAPLLASLLAASPAAAQGATGGPAAPGARKGLLRNIMTVFAPPTAQEERTIATTVGMSEEQKSQMKAVNERYRSDSTALVAKYNNAYDDVVRLMDATSPNKGEVNQTLKTFHQIHQEVLEREVGYWTDFKAILTPEQNRKFWNLFEQRRIRPGEGGGRAGAAKSAPGAPD